MSLNRTGATNNVNNGLGMVVSSKIYQEMVKVELILCISRNKREPKMATNHFPLAG
jgi:hypothetical protein